MAPETAVLIGAALATTGWLYTARRSRALARKQHTITVILQTNFNAHFLTARAKITPAIRSGELPSEQDQEFYSALRDVLNHYEFVSAGLRNGDFDERLIRDSERGAYIALYEVFKPHIWRLRNSRKRMTIYEHLEWVYCRWHEPPGRVRRCVEYVRGRPLRGWLDTTDAK
jgi:hypothetical protein